MRCAAKTTQNCQKSPRVADVALKHQWGWGGFTTQDLARCRRVSRDAALICNWRGLFVRLAGPGRRLGAIASRPLLLASIGALVRHARQTTLRGASSHGRAA